MFKLDGNDTSTGQVEGGLFFLQLMIRLALDLWWITRKWENLFVV